MHSARNWVVGGVGGRLDGAADCAGAVAADRDGVPEVVGVAGLEQPIRHAAAAEPTNIAITADSLFMSIDLFLLWWRCLQGGQVIWIAMSSVGLVGRVVVRKK
jgi:hypothetical protein